MKEEETDAATVDDNDVIDVVGSSTTIGLSLVPTFWFSHSLDASPIVLHEKETKLRGMETALGEGVNAGVTAGVTTGVTARATAAVAA